MKRWLDRQVFGVTLIAGFATYGAWTLGRTGEREFVQVSIVVGVFCLVCFYAMTHIRPGVSLRPDMLVVKNCFEAYEIPWGLIRQVGRKVGKGMYLTLDDGQVVRVEAFSNWPGFGRSARMKEELDAACRRYATAPASDQVSPVPSRGLLELALGVPVMVMLVSLVTAGFVDLFD